MRPFAQINEMDGFFLTGRDADPEFDWKKLEGAEVLVHHGGQPMTMFKYARYKAGIDMAKSTSLTQVMAVRWTRYFVPVLANISITRPSPSAIAGGRVGHVVTALRPSLAPVVFCLAARPHG